jgi:hypothetical protein
VSLPVFGGDFAKAELEIIKTATTAIIFFMNNSHLSFRLSEN